MVVVRVYFIERGMHHRLDSVKGIQHPLARGQVLLCAIQILQPQFDVGHICQGIDMCVLCFRFVHSVCQGCEKGQSFLVVCVGGEVISE